MSGQQTYLVIIAIMLAPHVGEGSIRQLEWWHWVGFTIVCLTSEPNWKREVVDALKEWRKKK